MADMDRFGSAGGEVKTREHGPDASELRELARCTLLFGCPAAEHRYGCNGY